MIGKVYNDSDIKNNNNTDDDDSSSNDNSNERSDSFKLMIVLEGVPTHGCT